MRRALPWPGAFAALVMCATAALYLVGSRLSAPAQHAVGAAPAGLQAVRIASEAGAVAGWHAPGRAGAGAVLLLHGLRGDRGAMLGRAQFLRGLGLGVLMIDLPAHGESAGEAISFGQRESAGVRAALAWLRSQAPGERVGVIGVSLGAASTVLAEPRLVLEAAVLESMYPSIEEAVADRLDLHLGAWARALAPLLLVQLEARLGLRPEDLRPIARIGGLGAPLLLISGEQDLHTRLPETERLFAAAAEPKALWIVPGAAHVDLHAYARAAYEQRVGAFLRERLSRRD